MTKQSDQPSNTGVDQACMGLSTRSWPKAAIKIHAGEHKRSCCVDVHRIKTAQKSKSCQSTKTEPLKKKYCLSHSCALLLPVIYFSPFVSPKTAILLLERLNIPVTDISDSEPIIYNIIIYRTTPSLSILSRQEYIAATWWVPIQNLFVRTFSYLDCRECVQKMRVVPLYRSEPPGFWVLAVNYKLYHSLPFGNRQIKTFYM